MTDDKRYEHCIWNDDELITRTRFTIEDGTIKQYVQELATHGTVEELDDTYIVYTNSRKKVDHTIAALKEGE